MMIALHLFGKTLYAIFFSLNPLAYIANLFANYGFLMNSKISFRSSGDNPIKISLKKFCRFRHFADFDIKIVP